MTDALPIDDVLEPLVTALRQCGRAVLQAPPGAGKTTRVPLALLKANVTPGRILVLEPRRLATRAAAERMASALGEAPGQTVGYRMRGENKVSGATRIEVITEGILTRQIQHDPGLDGVGAILFDEFHERSLNADLGLALALDVSGALREDLILVAMSATLDAAPVAALMGNVPVITSEGRSFPVDTKWASAPAPTAPRDIAPAAAALVRTALDETEGGVLVFLPGEREIRSAASALEALPGIVVQPLYGALPWAQQQAALRPSTSARKVVLATAIAETSLTIPDVRIVVDAGLARRARFDPGSGMTRLVTERASRAEADQRRGRAGRVAPGTCYRLWTKGEHGARPAFAPPEIETADLTSLALELAEWGAAALPFLTPPPPGPLSEARALLVDLGALEPGGGITDHGRSLARMPLHPRLGHMLDLAGPSAAPLAALLSERDPMIGFGSDLMLRLSALKRGDARANRAAMERIKSESNRLARSAGKGARTDPAEQAALAFPDRIALRRPGDQPRWLLSGGRGAVMAAEDALASAKLLVVTETDGGVPEARIRQALPISEAALRDVLASRVHRVQSCVWSKRAGRIEAWDEERIGEIALSRNKWLHAPADAKLAAMLDGVRLQGLSFGPAAARLRARIQRLRDVASDIPVFDIETLESTADAWLAPFLTGVESVADLKALDLTEPLKARLGYDRLADLDRLVPGSFLTPLDRKIAIDYAGDAPEIAVRLQEMFGVTQHPVSGGVPLRVTLLSPAGRPVQTTTDIPGFWATSYADVRKDMRGRYPKHPWPEDPTKADPTLRAKRRK